MRTKICDFVNFVVVNIAAGVEITAGYRQKPTEELG